MGLYNDEYLSGDIFCGKDLGVAVFRDSIKICVILSFVQDVHSFCDFDQILEDQNASCIFASNLYLSICIFTYFLKSYF